MQLPATGPSEHTARRVSLLTLSQCCGYLQKWVQSAASRCSWVEDPPHTHTHTQSFPIRLCLSAEVRQDQPGERVCPAVSSRASLSPTRIRCHSSTRQLVLLANCDALVTGASTEPDPLPFILAVAISSSLETPQTSCKMLFLTSLLHVDATVERMKYLC